MAKLFIIGNGFDLYHRMHTSYDNYRKFLEENNYHAAINFFERRINFDNDFCEWNDIENYSNLNCEDHFNDIVSQNYPNVGDENFRDSNWNDINTISELEFSYGIQFYDSLFQEWLKTVDVTREKIPLISSILSKDDFFISFNYTKTLEELYGIPDDHIFHIHGFLGDKRLQFGSINNNPFELKNTLESRYENEDFYGASVEYGVNNAVALYQSAYKSIDRNLNELNSFLNKIENENVIDNVVVFGHALKTEFMDKPYYERILVPRYRKNKWVLYFYSEEDKEKQFEFINDLKLQHYEQIKE